MARRSSHALDLFAAFGTFARERKLKLGGAEAAEGFVNHVRDAIQTGLKNPVLLHGQRTQNMFEAMVVALGGITLIKTEDAGSYHPKDRFALPDFRLVAGDGSQFLVEVKNHYGKDPTHQIARYKQGYFDKHQAYSAAVGCPLKIAIYWGRWGLWTLIDPDDFRSSSGKMELDMSAAVIANELAVLGDVTIGTKVPLQLRFLADKSKPHRLVGDKVEMTIAGTELLCDGVPITDELDKKIAWTLIEFGDWESYPAFAIGDGIGVEAIEFQWLPREPTDQGFDFIGTLSSIFSRYYARRTVEKGEIVGTEAEHVPDWLAPLRNRDIELATLPLWRFILKAQKTLPQVRD